VNKKVGILGGGFGLYGYLPAFANLDFEIFTLEKYERFIRKRADLTKYIKDINFLKEEDLLSKVDYISISRNPENQYKFLVNYKDYEFNHLYLEKPIAHNTVSYKKCIENLEIQKTNFSVFYSLTYMDWYRNIIEEIMEGTNQNFKIEWKIKQSVSTWKQDVLKGGGLLNFYGIHFFKMFIDSNLMLKNAKMSGDKLEIKLESENFNSLKIKIESSDKNLFSIYKNEELQINSFNPFLKEIIPELPDPRIEIIEKYIKSNLNSSLELEKNTIFWLDLIEEKITNKN
tara:strand:- start:2249 stop:3106 length:858 start_codon:yes stop_codon:yes gene_type:complete